MSDSSNSAKTRDSPHIPWKVRLFFSAYMFFLDASRRPNYTINRRLISIMDPKVSATSKPKRGVVSSDTTVDSTNIWFRLFSPAANSDASLPIIFYFHGGGFALMGADSMLFDDFCRRLAGEIQAVVVSVNYRLSPEHRHPIQYEDCFNAMKFVDDDANSDRFPANADFSKCFVAGDSAGGNIAHHVVVRAGEYEFRKLKLLGLICIQPYFGGEERTESEIRLTGAPLVSIERTDWMWKAFLPDGSDRDHPAVNVFGPNSVDISGVKFPGTLIVVGGFDPLQDWQRRYYAGLKKIGKEAELVEYPNAIHGFYSIPDFPESDLFITEVRNFMQGQYAK